MRRPRLRALAVASFHTLSRTEIAPTQSQPQATTPREQPRIAPPELSPRDADQYEEYLQRAEDFDLRRDWRPFMIWAE